VKIPQFKPKCQGQVIEEEFTGKNLTHFGGAGLITRFFERIGLHQVLSPLNTVQERKEGSYSPVHIILAVIYGLFLGAERPYAMGSFLAKDEVFKFITGLANFPSQSTLSRFLKWTKKKMAEKLAAINLNTLMEMRDGFSSWLKKGLTIDLDSHVKTVYGDQQRAKKGYNPKKWGRKSYHPLLAFIGETKDFISGIFRPGDHHTSYHAIDLLKAIVKVMPSGSIKRLRADSGFFSKDFILDVVKLGLEYYITVPLQTWVQKLILTTHDWHPISKGMSYAEIPFRLSANLATRLVVIRTEVKRGEKPKKQPLLLKEKMPVYDYQVISTGSKTSAYEVWKFYNKRASCENMIKEGIYSYGLDHVVSHNWSGNSLWFQAVMFAYNLMNWFKEGVLGQQKCKNFGASIRQRIFLVPSRLVNIGRRWRLKLEKSWAWRKSFELAKYRLISFNKLALAT